MASFHVSHKIGILFIKIIHFSDIPIFKFVCSDN